MYLNFPVAQGGGGYAGGGGGSAMEGGSSLAAAGAGGGGSGFLRAGLTASAVEPNTGAGSITFTYTMDPSISAPTASVPAGSTASTIIDGVAPSTAFSVLLDGTTVVASGTTPVTGGPVTQSFTVPADTSGGTHTLTLQVGGIRAATSAAFTVTAAIALAATGVSTPWWVAPGVAMLIAVGTLLLWWTSRRSRARLVR
ncbi:hypothetical protein GCM10025881_31780 [Pseudolysinimonas kribbensis]|uniref:Ig-like domain repeat protein n=1 Tax=Pseudolysinimonas kribbensis TaxID=433641 RepID=A0ABQ6KAI6_9MICO|nr:hypothetical protein [Pseudolysinimonas kribbensis]GMA96354.1 hypothetical protein GCM10025881_31780 [Pseudolysinimonas kribbensis]